MKNLLQKQQILSVDLLGLSLTQRCNALCPQCQCGDAQDFDMPKEVMERVFDEVKAVSDFVLKGGELMLAPEKLEELYQVLVDKNVIVERFSIATNGTLYDEKYFAALEKLRDYSDTKDRPMFVSFDKFHRDEGKRLLGTKRYEENIVRLSSHSLFGDFQLDCDVWALSDGRAKNLADKDITIFDSCREIQSLYLRGPNFSRVSRLIIGAHGDITNEMEYKLQQKNSFGNILRGDKINNALLRSPTVIKCQTADEWNKYTEKHNTEVSLMKIFASAKRIGIKEDKIWDVFK